MNRTHEIIDVAIGVSAEAQMGPFPSIPLTRSFELVRSLRLPPLIRRMSWAGVSILPKVGGVRHGGTFRTCAALVPHCGPHVHQ